MTLGDRVAVMRAGVLQQVGTPQVLYDEPANLFVAGFIGSPAMNFMPAKLEGDVVKLPMAEVRLPREAVDACGSADQLIAGVRPEHFEDAHLVGDKRDRGVTFTAKVEILESMGSELYAHFRVSGADVRAAELDELAADAGTAEVPGAGGGQIVARLDPASRAKQDEEIELWLDATKLKFFNADGGACLKMGKLGSGPARDGGPGRPPAPPEGGPEGGGAVGARAAGDRPPED
jgi:multiple sugar transport system ATP-binding protein